MRAWVMLAALLACGQAQAQAAALRTMTTLHGNMVYLRDLFDEAGHNADHVLGPGPTPGGRIVVGAAQLNAIARQFGVTWRSVSDTDQAVLEWPGRALRKDEAVEAVRLAVAASVTLDDFDIDLSGFVPPMVPAEGAVTSTVSQLQYDSDNGRFSAMLTVAAEGMNPVDIRISGRVDEMVEAPVPLTRLLPDTVLRPEDLKLSRVRATQVREEIARAPDQVVGMQLRRPVVAGQPLRLADLVRPPLVQRGALVQMELSVGDLSISGQAVALAAGAMGDRIRVQNANSHNLVSAEVVGPGRVRVVPDAAPATAAQYKRKVP